MSQNQKTRLKWEIGGMLVFKIVAILLALLFFFGPSHRLHVTPDTMQGHLLNPPRPS